MCKHCARIKLHPEDKPIVHAFMELTAKRYTEVAREEAGPNVDTSSINITADDLDVTVEANFTQFHVNPLFNPGPVMKMLREFQE